MKDAIIIGKGPAGISAAIYLKRAGFDVLVIGKDLGSLAKTDKIENYYGFTEPISGLELVGNGIKQATRIGVEILSEEVVGVTKMDDFTVTTTNGVYESKTVLFAMGKVRQGIRVKGFKEFEGRGISFCAVCDGFFYRDKRIAVIGSGDYAASELKELMAFSKDITVFTDGKEISTDAFPKDIKIVTQKITEIYGEQTVGGIKTDSQSYDVDGIFVAIGTAGATDFATKLGAYTDGDTIEVESDFATNIKGLYAAGDCTGGFLQIATAVSDGANASKAMIKYLKGLQ